MIQWMPFVYLRLTFFLIAGILTYYFSAFYSDYLLYGFIFCTVLYAVLVFTVQPKSRYIFSPLMGFLAFCLIFLFGWIHTFHYTAFNQLNNISKEKDTIQAYLGIVNAEVQIRKKTFKTEITIQAIQTKGKWKTASGNLLLYIRKDTTIKNPKINLFYGDKILVRGSPQLVKSMGNPNAFDYVKYLKLQNIYHQHFIQMPQFKVISSKNANWLMYYAILARQYCDATFRKLIGSEREYGLASALVLGIKDGLDSEVIQAYSNTGTTHVLAVSGMHVALIFLVLDRLIGKRFKKKRKAYFFFAAFALAFLWFYAFITGLSASVLRAVVMFSFIIVAKVVNRRTNIYNTLAVSAFVLLIYNPYLALSVGFQLSYLAVIGIVYLQPKFSELLTVRTWLGRETWNLICVSVAAQIATFPLSLYYFHQFPNYFLLSNLMVIPISTGALYLGLVTLLFSTIPYLNYILGFLLKWNLWLMNAATFLVEELPNAVLSGIQINWLEMIAIYLILIYICLLFEIKKFRFLSFAFGLLFLVAISQIYQIYRQQKQAGIIIYNIPKSSNLQIIEGRKSTFWADSNLLNDADAVNFNIKSNLTAKGITSNQWNAWQDSTRIQQKNIPFKQFEKYALMVWKGKVFLIIEKYMQAKELQSLSKIKADYLVVQHNAVFDLKKLKAVLNFQFLIVDASNGWKRSQKLAQEAKDLKIPFHLVAEQGAFVLEN